MITIEVRNILVNVVWNLTSRKLTLIIRILGLQLGEIDKHLIKSSLRDRVVLNMKRLARLFEFAEHLREFGVVEWENILEQVLVRLLD